MYNLTNSLISTAYYLKDVALDPIIRNISSAVVVTIGLAALSAYGYYLARTNPADLTQREIRLISSDDPIYQRVAQRELQAKALSKEERRKYIEGPIADNGEIKPDIIEKRCGFNPGLRWGALFKIVDKTSQKETYVDMREVAKNPEFGVTYYAPFTFSEERERALGSINSGWLALSSQQDQMYINRIDTCRVFFGRSRGLGSAMVQFAIEKSLAAGFEGRVGLRSEYGSGVFYYKLGFVSPNPEYQKQIEAAARAGKQIDGHDMYLPEAAIAAWKGKIHKNPISVKKPSLIQFWPAGR